MPDGKAWPRISVVTPSYNQGQYIEETIRSVLLQGYPDLEYIIMDGGSTDGAIDIIRKYEPWLTHWQSGPDGGQSAAIKDGFAQISGEIQAWINSDDGYLLSSFQSAAQKLARTRRGFVYSNTIVKKLKSNDVFVRSGPVRKIYLTRGGFIPQHTTFWTTDFGLTVDDRLTCNFDSELWFRLIPEAHSIMRLSGALAYCYAHDAQKTVSSRWKSAWDTDNKIIYSIHKHQIDKINRARHAIEICYRIESRWLQLCDLI